MTISEGKTIIGAEALASAGVGACTGMLLLLVPWMWSTFPSGAPSEETVMARSVASGIERVVSIFGTWPSWGGAAIAGALVGLIVGVVIDV